MLGADPGLCANVHAIDRMAKTAHLMGRKGNAGEECMTLRALLVEDEANILEAVRFLLVRRGWEVFAHGNGANAVDEIARRMPDVIVLDVMLPGRSGLEILSDMRAKPALSAIPVLMLTAKGQDRDRDTALSLGANAYLTKPFANDELVSTIEDLVAAAAAARGSA